MLMVYIIMSITSSYKLLRATLAIFQLQTVKLSEIMFSVVVQLCENTYSSLVLLTSLLLCQQ